MMFAAIQRRIEIAVLRLRRGRLVRGEDGGSLVEFAFVTTAMMTFVLVVMQLCIAFYSYGLICETAREATRWASTRGGSCQTSSLTSCTATPAQVTSYAQGLKYPNIGGGTLGITTTNPDTFNSIANCQAASACRVVVAINYTVKITLPLVPKNAIAISTQSEMYYLQ